MGFEIDGDGRPDPLCSVCGKTCKTHLLCTRCISDDARICSPACMVKHMALAHGGEKTRP